jgi:AcrR family transcriptional regulator
MEDIAKQAELSKGALYIYFKSKDELYLSIALSMLDEVVLRLERVAAEAHPSGLAEVHALIRTYIGQALDYGSSFRVAMSWISTDFPLEPSGELFAVYRSRIARMYELGHTALERARADGSLPESIKIERLGMQIWGAALGLILLEQSGPEVERRLGKAIPLGGIAEQFLETFFSALSLAAVPGSQHEKTGESAQGRTS